MSKLSIGKLDSDVLQKIVIDQIEHHRDEVKTGAAIGEDCAVLDFGKYECVVSTDPITAAVEDIGRLAIHISCNDVASNGIEPLGITLAVMLPVGTTDKDVQSIMAQAVRAAKLCGVEIIGGHTEVTAAVNQPVIVSTAFGRGLAGDSQYAHNMQVGDIILMTKTAGIEGTGIIATEKESQLNDYLDRTDIKHAQALLDQVSVVKEGVIAGRIGTAGMHDVTEGGIFGAVWEMCHIADLGAEVRVDDIPVDPVTLKIADHYRIDYLRLISSGCMLIMAPPEKAEVIKKAVSDAGIQITAIGTVRPLSNGIMAVKDNRKFTIVPPSADELYKAVK